MEKTKTVTKVNNVSILLIDNGEKFVPVKPICEALGIEFNGQYERINRHEILAPTIRKIRIVAADQKEREMVCIPFKFVFGWLFTIQPNMVNEEARETIIRYQTECYEALFRYFTDQSEFLEQKQRALEFQIDELERIKADFKNAKQKLDEARKKLAKVKEMTFEEWQANNQQITIDFPEFHD